MVWVIAGIGVVLFIGIYKLIEWSLSLGEEE